VANAEQAERPGGVLEPREGGQASSTVSGNDKAVCGGDEPQWHVRVVRAEESRNAGVGGISNPRGHEGCRGHDDVTRCVEDPFVQGWEGGPNAALCVREDIWGPDARDGERGL